MRSLAAAFFLLSFLPIASAQLTMDQKLADFQQLAALFAKNYAPYEWKVQVEKFDLYDIGPWLDRVRATQTDLEFLDVCTRYVGSLNDGHANFNFETDFIARLGFAVDLYEEKALVEQINRTRLPVAQYPFEIGDELISVDGRPVENWLRELSPYTPSAHARATRRFAANLITIRPQAVIPRAVELGESAQVVIQRQNGELATYSMPWVKSGTPIFNVGPVPSPRTSAKTAPKTAARAAEADAPPEYPRLLPNVPGFLMRASKRPESILGYESVPPIWRLPQGFATRLGRSPIDYFYSGTFVSGGWRIGYIRIPTFFPDDPDGAFSQFVNEVLYMERNTDGLVVDVMRNGGGYPCYSTDLASLLIPYQHRAIGLEWRANLFILQSYLSNLETLKAARVPDWQIAYYEAIVGDLKQAYRENRGRSGPLPDCGISLELNPFTDSRGNIVGYSKPLMVLTDELSASAAESFTAQIQDAGRAVVFGQRTSGLGGGTVGWDLTTYSEGTGRITIGMMNRKRLAEVEGYPVAPYIENVGVHPDIVEDYMTRDNLTNSGQTFVRRFTDIIVQHINNSQ